jgi:hypothetical protein
MSVYSLKISFLILSLLVFTYCFSKVLCIHLTVYTLVVRVCPAKFNTKNSAFCPHSVFKSHMGSDCFYVQHVPVEAHCFFCEVQTESLIYEYIKKLL